MKKRIYIINIMLVTAAAVHAQGEDFLNLTGPYLGQKAPRTTPNKFAPGVE